MRFSLSLASWRRRVKIRCDCTGEPPGELMTTATVGSFEKLNAFSMAPATDASAKPGRSGVAMPMGPEKRNTGTVGLRRNRPIEHPQEATPLTWGAPAPAQAQTGTPKVGRADPRRQGALRLRDRSGSVAVEGQCDAV